MKSFFCSIFSLLLLLGCANNHYTNRKNIVFQPVEPAANILYGFNDFWNYWSDTVRLSERFIALDTNNIIITKEKFLTKLLSGKYLPLRLQANNHDSAYYKLYKLDTSINKDIPSTIVDLTMVYNHLFQMQDQVLPGFHFVDLNGKIYDAETCKGKIVVLNFWFIHCASCLQEMPQLNKLVLKYKDRKDIVFVSLALDNAAQLKSFLSKNKFDYAVVPDMSKYIYDTIQINTFPTHIILDRNSRVVYTPEDYQELFLELKKQITLDKEISRY